MKYKGNDIGQRPPRQIVASAIKRHGWKFTADAFFAYWDGRQWTTNSGEPVRTLEAALGAFNGLTLHQPKPRKTKAVESRKTSPTTYAEQLTSPRWLAFRERVFQTHGRRCERCGSSDRLQVHHITYKAGKKAWQYKSAEVMVLCDTCHARLHHKDAEARQEERHLQSCVLT